MMLWAKCRRKNVYSTFGAVRINSNYLQVNLIVRIPDAAVDGSPDVLILARRAPTFTVEGQGQERTCVAIFTDLPQALDLAVRLIGAVINIPGAWGRHQRAPGCDVTRFWSALLCYHESLDEAGPHDYCMRKAAVVSYIAGCPDRTCLSHCQFTRARCFGVVHGRGAALSERNPKLLWRRWR